MGGSVETRQSYLCVCVRECVHVTSLYLSTALVSDKLSDPFRLLVGLHGGCPGEGVE